MSQLTSLFKGAETWLGVFYPKDFVIAAFQTLEVAKTAEHHLRNAGFPEEEMRAVPGSELLDFLSDLHERKGIVGDVMTHVSRFMGTEAEFEDTDIKEAKLGAGFLAVHCPTEPEAEKVHRMLLPFEPVSAQWYHAAGIRSLV